MDEHSNVLRSETMRPHKLVQMDQCENDDIYFNMQHWEVQKLGVVNKMSMTKIWHFITFSQKR